MTVEVKRTVSVDDQFWNYHEAADECQLGPMGQLVLFQNMKITKEKKVIYMYNREEWEEAAVL